MHSITKIDRDEVRAIRERLDDLLVGQKTEHVTLSQTTEGQLVSTLIRAMEILDDILDKTSEVEKLKPIPAVDESVEERLAKLELRVRQLENQRLDCPRDQVYGPSRIDRPGPYIGDPVNPPWIITSFADTLIP